jgi:hypothetical protein
MIRHLAGTIVACLSLLLATHAFGQDVWLGPNNPNGSGHYTELLQSAAGWPTTVKNVKVFKISNQFAVFASDAEFSAFVEGTKRLNLQIAMEGLMLTSSDRCGAQVEGYSGPGAVLRAAQRIKKYGAKLSYIAMDSVLIFGHEYSGPHACRDSIESLASQVAQKVAQARSVFPDIQVGDIEPIGNPRPGWLTDITEWSKAYRAATGTSLAFFQFDVDWNNPNWPQQLKAGANLIQSLGIPIGVTYNGTKFETSGRAWVAKAVEHFRRVKGELKIHPSIAVIQSWNLYPEKMTPETDPEALTYVIREYSRTAKNN